MNLLFLPLVYHTPEISWNKREFVTYGKKVELLLSCN